MRSIDLHLSVESIVEDEIMRHPYPVGFHWMALAVVIIANVSIIIIANLFLRGSCHIVV